MRDLTIDGNFYTQIASSGSCGGINALGAVQCRFENIHFTSCRDDALYLGGMTGGAFGHNNIVSRCLFDQTRTSPGPGRAIQMNSNDENQIVSCDFEYLGGSGTGTKTAILDLAGTQQIIGCNFVNGGNNAYAIRCQDAAANTKITNCNFDGNAGDCVFLATTNCSVTDCTFFEIGIAGTAGQASGVHLEYAAQNNKIHDNTFVSSATNGQTRSLIREENIGGSGNNSIQGNILSTKGTLSVGTLDLNAPGTIVRNNMGAGSTGDPTGNPVTVDTTQTVTGDKTFTGLTTITGLPAQDLKYAIELSGVNGSNVALGVKTYLDGAKPFSFGTWVDFYNNAFTDDGAVWGYGYSNPNDKGYAVRVDGATKRLQFFWGASTNQATAANTYCYGRMWLVLTYDGVSTLKVYKNNVLMDTLTIAARNADATIGSYLGTRDGTARNLSGALDDAFLYNRVLTSAELTGIYRNASFPTSGNLFLYHFDERTGTTAIDSSGSGNNGTINAGTYRVSEFGNPNRSPAVPTTWQASLANADLAKTCVVFVGSSTTQGGDSTTLDNRYTDVLGALLHKQFNSPSVPGGKHIRAADSGWTTTGTASLNSDGLGLNSYSLSAGATLSRTLTSCTGFDLHFVQGPGQGTFTYQVDGGSAVTVTPSTTGTTNRHDGNVTVTGLTLGSHTIQINATNACIINGVYVHNGDATTGVRVYNCGKGGTTTADFVASNASTIWQRAAAIGNMNLVAVMLGSNDFSTSLDPATFKANLLTLIHNVWSNLSTTRPDIVLINSYRRYDQVGFGTTYTYGQYGAKMQELAAELDGVQYVDVSGLFPLMNDAVHDPLDLMNTDNIHMNDAGHRYMARILLRSLAPSM
jgi:lysophospholipase L1-like esterase